MYFRFESLDESTRRYMAQELARDLVMDTVYLSPRLSQEGRAAYPALLEEVLRWHDPEWLADALRFSGYLAVFEERRSGDDEPIQTRVPTTAAEMLATDEFNRYYMRGVCLRALAEGVGMVEVYRGRESLEPRPASQAMIGSQLSATALLEDLRSWPDQTPVLGLPTGYNSGLSVRLPTHAQP
jgi:hypothetical protein